MKKSTLGIIIAVVAVLAIVGIVIANKQNSSNMATNTTEKAHDETNSDGHHKDGEKDENGFEDLTNQSEVTMDIKDFAFSKAKIKIKKGTKVTWTNQDSAKHNAFSDDDNGPKGKLLGKGQSYSFVFNNVGTTDYYCTPHPYMKGIVNVVQ